MFCLAIYASVTYHYMHTMLAHENKREFGRNEGNMEHFVGHRTRR